MSLRTRIATFLTVLCICNAAAAQIAPLKSTLIASGLEIPVFAVQPPGELHRLFIGELNSGRIMILDLDSGLINPEPFLIVEDLLTRSESGLLGMAFDPDYATNGFFYINCVALDRRTNIRRYKVSTDPDAADPDSRFLLMAFEQPSYNHNGGWIAFGPDRFLYISSGDSNNSWAAQVIVDQRLGKILRIDVRGDDFPNDPERNYANPPDNPFVGIKGDDEIWAYGLRNPWRCSFDRQTGNLWIADVGSTSWEEVNFQPASSPGGENYGWSCYEGNHGSGCGPPQDLTFPIHEYPHNRGAAVIGGFVYQGCDIPSLRNTYFFADISQDTISSFRYDGYVVSELTDRTEELDPGGGLSIASLTSFGQDTFGELYMCDLDGEVYRIERAESLCPADRNGDNIANVLDFIIYFNDFAAQSPCADTNKNGTVNTIDMIEFLNAYNTGCD